MKSYWQIQSDCFDEIAPFNKFEALRKRIADPNNLWPDAKGNRVEGKVPLGPTVPCVITDSESIKGIFGIKKGGAKKVIALRLGFLIVQPFMDGDYLVQKNIPFNNFN